MISIWVVLFLLGGLLTSRYLSGALTTQAEFTNNPDSKQARQLLKQRLAGPRRSNEVVIVRSESQTVTDPEFKAYVRRLKGDLDALTPAVVQQAIDPYQAGNRLVSDDRHATLIPVTMAGTLDDANARNRGRRGHPDRGVRGAGGRGGAGGAGDHLDRGRPGAGGAPRPGHVASRSWSPPNRRPIPMASASRHSIPTVTGSSSVSGPDAQAATADHQPAEPDPPPRAPAPPLRTAVPSTDLLLVPDLDGVVEPQRLVDGSFDVLGDEDRLAQRTSGSVGLAAP